MELNIFKVRLKNYNEFYAMASSYEEAIKKVKNRINTNDLIEKLMKEDDEEYYSFDGDEIVQVTKLDGEIIY